jgi:hypothetical protein
MGKQVPFTYSNHTTLLDIPNIISINEHAYRLLDQWQLPVFLFPSIEIHNYFRSNIFCCSTELQEALRLFFNEQIQIAADEMTQLAVEPFIKGELEIQTVLDQWFKLVQVNIYSKLKQSFFCSFFLIIGI